jgi:hypothetical protein
VGSSKAGRVGRIARALHGPTKLLRRHSVVGVAVHGKVIGEAVDYERIIE